MAEVGAITYFGTIEKVSCGNCGIPFGLPTEMKANRQKDGKTFYCPNGCIVGWTPGPSEADKLRDRLAAAQAREDQLRASLASQRSMTSHERHRVRTYKGKLTSAKRRAACGVCPGCKRSFQNVARHVAHMHPELLGKVDES